MTFSVGHIWRTLHSAFRSGVALSFGAACLAGCNEQLDSNAGCPVICGNPALPIQDVILDAVSLDTTVAASVGIGTETVMLLASRGDSLDTRLIFRFDTLPSTARLSSTATSVTPIAVVDSVFLRLHFDSLGAKATVPVTVSLYDVDSAGINDTLASDLDKLFTPARLIGTRTFAAGKLVDTVSVPLSNAVVLFKAQNHLPLRVGVRVTAATPATSVSLRQLSAETPFRAFLYMRVSSDFAVPSVSLPLYSVGSNATLAAALRDFMIIVKGTPPVASTFLAIGGLPSTRTYFRFNIPSSIVDSALVVRATLLLTQVPSNSPDLTDTLSIQPYAVVAGAAVTDPGRAAHIVSATIVPFEVFNTFPSASGLKTFEVAPVFSVWAADTTLPRALMLQSTGEGISPQLGLFYSSEATDVSLRPKLRISYTPRTRIGVP